MRVYFIISCETDNPQLANSEMHRIISAQGKSLGTQVRIVGMTPVTRPAPPASAGSKPPARTAPQPRYPGMFRR